MPAPHPATGPILLDDGRLREVSSWLATDGGPPRDRDPAEALAWASAVAPSIPAPGSGATAERWEFLAQLGRLDLVLARAVEPHLDAHAILADAGREPAPGSWAVWAAEGPSMRLEASQEAGAWTLDGVKPWCSLAGSVDHALVTAWIDERRRQLFWLDLSSEGVEIDSSDWSPLGLAPIVTATVRCTRVRAEPVGAPDWYLQRPGFWWGGIGVAAVWLGAAVALGERVISTMERRDADAIGWSQAGSIDAALWPVRQAMARAAATVDAGPSAEAAPLLSARVRQATAGAAETALGLAGHALGPGPLTTDAEHIDRVRDLQVYLRQHHAERDAAALGRLLRDARRP